MRRVLPCGVLLLGPPVHLLGRGMPRATLLLHRPPPTHLPCRPPTRPRGQPGSHWGYPRVLLRKRPHPAPRIRTPPPAFPPLQNHRPAETRLIHQPRPSNPYSTPRPRTAVSLQSHPHHLNTPQPPTPPSNAKNRFNGGVGGWRFDILGGGVRVLGAGLVVGSVARCGGGFGIGSS